MMNKHPVALAVALALTAAVPLSACNRMSSLTAEEHVQRAKDYQTKGDLSNALIELKNAIEKSPNDAQARLLLGQNYLDAGDVVAAEKELARAKELGIANTLIAIPLANALLLQGKSQAALEKLADVSGLNANGMAELHMTRGKALLGLGNVADAEKEFQAAMNAKADAPAAWEGQAILAYSRQQWDEASRWTEKILASDPRSVRALGLKGDIALARVDASAAEAAYAAAVKLQPLNPMYRIGLGIALISNDKYAAAKDQLDRVLKGFPLDPTANYYRAVAAYQLKDYAGAKDFSEKVLNALAQEDLRLRLMAAASNYVLGQQEAANKHIQLFLRAAPGYEPARKLQAAIQLKMGKSEAAAASLKDVSDVSDEDAKLLSAVGLTAIQRGQAAAGLALLEQNVQARPNDPLARARLGLAKSAAGDVRGGVAELEEALRMNPKLGSTEVLLALSHLRAGDADKALEAAQRLQKLVPGSPDGHSLAGLAYIAKKQNAEARAAFNRALSLQPGDPNASHNLASLALLEGDAKQARQLLQGVLEKHPQHTKTLLRLADLDVRSGQAKAAENSLGEALAKNPELLPVRLALGQLQLGLRSPEKALKNAEDGLQKVPADAGLLTLKGLAQLALGQPNLAVTSLENAAKAAPNAPDVQFHLAQAYEQIGNRERAGQALQATLKLAPGHGPAKFAQARLLAQGGKPEAAQKQLAELSARYPNDPAVHETRGDLALAQNKAGEAAGFYRQALAKRETNFLAVKLAAAQLRAGDREPGLATLRDWLKRYPDDVYARGALADALLGTGQTAEAGTHYAKILERHKDNVSALNNLAWLSLQGGALDKAASYAERAYKLAPKQPQVLDTYASVLLRKGNARTAVERLREAQALARGNTAISLSLAQALIADRKADEARLILRTLLTPGTPPAHKQKAEELLKAIP
jgi:putative PEP-CTERM system TPR-repeat lipoprotein